MVVMLSHIIFVEVNLWFQTRCQTRLSHYPQSSLSTLDAPPGVVPAEAETIDVRTGAAMIAPEREVPAAVLGMDISEAGEHLSVAEVELGNEHDFSA